MPISLLLLWEFPLQNRYGVQVYYTYVRDKEMCALRVDETGTNIWERLENLQKRLPTPISLLLLWEFPL